MSRWFRHYAGMMRDDKLVRVALKSRQTVERVVWVWGAILESAGEINDDGRYDLDTAEAAYFLRADEADICTIIVALEVSGRVAEGRVVKWGARQFQSDRSAARQAAYRERKRSQGSHSNDKQASDDGGVTLLSRHRDAPETETETETETELETDKEQKEIRTVAKATRPALDQEFEVFKKTYPKRKGSNPWKPARRLFDKARKGGTSLDQMLSALRAGVGFDREKLHTEFIPQAVKWLRDRRWEDHQPTTPDLSAEDREKIFAKLREKPSADKSGERADLRETGFGARENEGAGRQGSAGPPDNQTGDAGMGRVVPIFQEPSGLRANSDEAGAGGIEPVHDRSRVATGRF